MVLSQVATRDCVRPIMHAALLKILQPNNWHINCRRFYVLPILYTYQALSTRCHKIYRNHFLSRSFTVPLGKLALLWFLRTMGTCPALNPPSLQELQNTNSISSKDDQSSWVLRAMGLCTYHVFMCLLLSTSITYYSRHQKCRGRIHTVL